MLLGILKWVLLLSFILFFLVRYFQTKSIQQVAKPTLKVLSPAKTNQKLADTINIVAVGDIMMGSAYPSTVNLPFDDGEGSFAATKPYLQAADVTFGNLEGVFLDKGNSDKCVTNSTACYAFRMPQRYIKHLTDAGFNLLSVANNHSGDFNEKGRNRTSEMLDSAKINFAGFTTRTSVIFKKNGFTYGFCAFAPNEGTVSITDLNLATNIISNLKSKVDIVIVSFHGGAEGANHQHVTRKPEIFYKQNRGNVYQFAHNAINAGADLVLGHGPHVTRAVEMYNNRFIAYSLGNFCTYGMFNVKGANGTAPLMQIKLDNKGQFISANVVSVLQIKNQHAIIDTNNNALKRIKELTAIDFPESKLMILDNGTIIPKP